MDAEIKEKLVTLKDNKATLFGSSDKQKTDELPNKIQEVSDLQDVQDSDEQVKLTSLESIKAALKDLQPKALSSSSLDEAKKLLEYTFSIEKESLVPEDDLEDLFSEESSQQDEENNDQQIDGSIDLSADEKGSKKRLNEDVQKTDDKKLDIDFGSTFETKRKKHKSKKGKPRPVKVNPLFTDTTTVAAQWGSQQSSKQKQVDNLDVNADDSVRILVGLFAQEQGILPVQQRLIKNRKTAIFYQNIHRELGQMLTAIYLNLIHREAGKGSKIVTHAMDYISAGSGLIPVPFASGVIALFSQLVIDGVALFNRHKDKEMQQSLGQVNEQVWNPAYAQYVAETVARNLTEAYEHWLNALYNEEQVNMLTRNCMDRLNYYIRHYNEIYVRIPENAEFTLINQLKYSVGQLNYGSTFVMATVNGYIYSYSADTVFCNPYYNNMRTIKIEDLPKLPSQRDVDNLKSQYNQLLERVDFLEKTVLPVMSAPSPSHISGVSRPNIGK